MWTRPIHNTRVKKTTRIMITSRMKQLTHFCLKCIYFTVRLETWQVMRMSNSSVCATFKLEGHGYSHLATPCFDATVARIWQQDKSKSKSSDAGRDRDNPAAFPWLKVRPSFFDSEYQPWDGHPCTREHTRWQRSPSAASHFLVNPGRQQELRQRILEIGRASCRERV